MELEELLRLSVELQASDLHIIPGLPPLIRVNGDLIPIPNFEALDPETAKQLIYSVMSVDQQVAFEDKLTTEFPINYPGVCHFRVSVFHQRAGVSAALRVIPDKIPTMNELSLPPVFKALLAL